MTATLDDEVADLRRANAELQQRLNEGLAREAATVEILQVINSSPGDLASVFDAMLDKATLLSEAAFGVLWTYDGELFHAVAFRDVPPAYAEFLREPHHAGGCIAQAWSVAEFLRAWIKLDMVRLKPDTTETRMADTRTPEGVTVSR